MGTSGDVQPFVVNAATDIDSQFFVITQYFPAFNPIPYGRNIQPNRKWMSH